MPLHLRHLRDRLDRLPLLKALVPFAAGLLLAGSWMLPGWLCLTAIGVAALLALLFRSAVATGMLLLAAGFGLAQLREPHRTLPIGVDCRFELRVEGVPTARKAYRVVEAVATGWSAAGSDRWHATNDRLLLYTDTLTTLLPGEQLLCTGRVRDFRGAAEGYRRQMRRRGFAGSLWIDARRVLARTSDREPTLHARAVERIERLGLSPETEALALAMAAGERSRFPSELRDRYARSGCSHLLAVSGLHTGILFGWIALLFGWLLLLRRGDRIYRLLCAVAVWIFVAAAGFPPSAVRAALLCTLLQGALLAGRAYEALNALALAAFAMLLWQPAWIGDVSFQLSFVAVAALLVWGVPLQQRLRWGPRVVRWIAKAWAVSVVAGVATAPLVAHYFGLVPVAGILLSPVAIALAAAVVLCGTLWMAVPWAGWAPLLRGAIEGSAALLDALVRWAADLPGGSFAWNPSATTVGLIYAALLAATLLAAAREPKR